MPTTTDKLAKPSSFAGTMQLKKRVEALKINLTGVDDVTIKYSVHQQNFGWSEWTTNGEVAGVTGKSKRAEAIAIVVEGLDKYGYDLYYRAHVQGEGWLDWVKAESTEPTLTLNKGVNDGYAGKVGYSKRLEAVEIALVKTETTPGSVADVTTSFNTWVNSKESGLQDFELDTFKKYAEVTEFKAIIDEAKADLAKAADVKEAEDIVAQAKADLLAQAKVYAGEKLQAVYEDAGADGYVLTEKNYQTVRTAIANSNDIPSVMKLYADAVKDRITTDQYDLMAAQNDAKAELNEYVSGVKLDKNVTLDEAVTAQVETERTNGKTAVDAVTERQYKNDKQIVNKKVKEAEDAIDALYTLANEKASKGKSLDTDIESYLNTLDTTLTAQVTAKVITAEDVTKAKEDLKEAMEADKKLMAATVTSEDYQEALNAAYNDLNLYKEIPISVATLKATAKQKNGQATYTDADKAKMNKALEEAIALVEAEKDFSKFTTTKSNAEAKLDAADTFIGNINTARGNLTTYVGDEVVPNTDPEVKYKDVPSIKKVVDSEIAKIDAFTTQEELNADATKREATAKMNIYEAVRAYMVQVLDETAKLTAKEDDDQLLELTDYQALTTNRRILTTALKEAEVTNFNKTLSGDLYTTFEGMVTLQPVGTVRTAMLGAFNKDSKEDITVLDKAAVGYEGTYADILTIGNLLTRARNTINNAESYTDFETAMAVRKNDLPTEVGKELGKLVDKLLKELEARQVKTTINGAETVKEKVSTYETAVAKVAKETKNDTELKASAESLTKAVTDLKNGSSQQKNLIKGLNSVAYDEKTNTATFTVDKDVSEDASSLLGFLLVGDETNNVLNMFDAFAEGATSFTYSVLGNPSDPIQLTDVLKNTEYTQKVVSELKTLLLSLLGDGKFDESDIRTLKEAFTTEDGKEKIENSLLKVAAEILVKMSRKPSSGDSFSDLVSDATSLTYNDVKDTTATATFNFKTENGVEYSVDYTLKFVKAAN